MLARCLILLILAAPSCGPKNSGELEALKQRKTELDHRVTSSLDERNALQAKLGSIRAAQAAQPSEDILAKVVETEQSVLALRREKEEVESQAASATRILETLKKR